MSVSTSPRTPHSRTSSPRYVTGVVGVLAALATSTIAASPVAAQSTEPTSFACDPGFYQVISGQLSSLDPGNGSYNQIGPNSSNYNAVGYRIADGLLYGIRNTELLRIDAAGTVSVVTTLPFPGGSYTGDFADDGLLHVSRGGRDWHAIDVETGQATAMPAISGNHGIADIANVHGVFYGVSSAGSLIRIDPQAQTVVNVGKVSGLPATSMSYGAAWSSAGGNLYIGRNSGEIYQVTGYSGATPTATQVATAPGTNSNDGASCSLAAAPAGIVDVDGPEPETEPSTPEAQAAADAHTEREQTSYAFPSSGMADGPSCATGVDEDRPPRLAVNAQAVSSPTVVYASGPNPDLNDFDVLSGLWSTGSGSLEQTHSCGYDYTALLRSEPLDHYLWEATLHGVNGVNQSGLIVNQSSPLTRSGATMIDLAAGGSILRWGSYDDRGYYQMIGSRAVDGAAAGLHLTVEVHNTTVSVRIDDEVVAEFSTKNGGGLVGLVSSKSAAEFTNVQLTALPQGGNA